MPILTIYIVMDEKIRGRIRLHASKPVPTDVIGLARILYPTIYYLILVSLYLIVSLAHSWYECNMLNVDVTVKNLMNYDFMLSVVWFNLLFTYIGWSFLEGRIRIVPICILGAILFSVISPDVFGGYYFQELGRLFDHSQEPAFSSMTSIVLVTLIYFSFTRRKSFLK